MLKRFFSKNMNNMTVGETLGLIGGIYAVSAAIGGLWILIDKIDWAALKEKLPKRKQYAKLKREEDIEEEKF